MKPENITALGQAGGGTLLGVALFLSGLWIFAIAKRIESAAFKNSAGATPAGKTQGYLRPDAVFFNGGI